MSHVSLVFGICFLLCGGCVIGKTFRLQSRSSLTVFSHFQCLLDSLEEYFTDLTLYFYNIGGVMMDSK